MSPTTLAVPTSGFTSLDLTSALDADGLYRPTGDEVALGHLHDGGAGATLGHAGPASGPANRLRDLARDPAPRGTARTALEGVLLEHLQRGPCVVTFSGGRDSSAVLALAAHVAAREGLPAPIAATHDFPGDPEADEREWQHAVLDHLAAAGTPVEHVRVPSAPHFDLLGETATAGLREHGLLWSAPVHSLTSMWALARGAAVLTGQGGDEVIAGQRCAPLALLRRRRGRLRANRPAAAVALAPEAVRAGARRRRERDLPAPGWLTPAGLARTRATDRAGERGKPLLFADALAAHRRDRGFALGLATSGALAAAAGAVEAHPLLDARFTAALAAEGHPFGFGNRTSAMVRVFDGLLPHAVLHRSTKARFHTPTFGPAARAFAQRWSGQGLDDGLVDPAALRACWLSEAPWAGTMLALQAAWLHDAGLPRRPVGVAAHHSRTAPGAAPAVPSVAAVA